jgi:hypothetical protein
MVSSGAVEGGEAESYIIEYYKVLPMVDGQVMVQQLSEEGGEPTGEPIKINLLDKDEKLSHDFQRVNETRNEGGMPGGMPGPRRGGRR